ncbi:MAG: GNAT family N-acetyltransferase [Pseudomonadota bacterium]
MRFACEAPPSGKAALFALSLQEHLPTLATDRLILRAPRVTDFEAFAEIACSERGEHIGGPMSREDAWLDFAQATATWILHGHGVWTIGHASEVAGFVLLGFEPGDREPELGFLLCTGAEGKGIAFEAAQAARQYAFTELGWDTLVSYIAPENVRSIALVRRLGARFDGVIDEAGEVAHVYRHNREVAR